MNFIRSLNLKWVPIIIFINILVFILWYVLPVEFMMSHFVVSWDLVMSGHLGTLMTSLFSHSMLFHIFINMYILIGFGTILETVIGSRKFICFYLLAGLISSLFHIFVSRYFIGTPEQAALGASGAIAGLVLLFSLLFPKERLYIFGFIPVPALLGALIFIGIDVWGLIAQSEGGGLPIGHGAHLGGAFTGIVYYFLLKHQIKNNRLQF